MNLEPSSPLKALAAVAAIIALAMQFGLAGPARRHDTPTPPRAVSSDAPTVIIVIPP